MRNSITGLLSNEISITHILSLFLVGCGGGALGQSEMEKGAKANRMHNVIKDLGLVVQN